MPFIVTTKLNGICTGRMISGSNGLGWAESTLKSTQNDGALRAGEEVVIMTSEEFAAATALEDGKSRYEAGPQTADQQKASTVGMDSAMNTDF